MSGKMVFPVLNAVLCILFALGPSTLTYAWDRHHDGRDHWRDRDDRHDDRSRFSFSINMASYDYVPVLVSGSRYYYYDGSFYLFTPNGYIPVAPPMGAIVPVLPPEYRPVIINGMPFYTYNGFYYVMTRNGYQVVPPPAIQPVPVVQMLPPPAPVVVTRPVELVPEPQNQTKVAEGIGLGGILGALAGGVLGHQMKGRNDVNGALLGGAAGAAIGGILGAQIPNENASTPVLVERPASVVVTQPQEVAVPVQVPVPVPVEETFQVNVPDGKGGYVPVVIRKSGSGYLGPQGEYYPEFPKVSQLQVMYSK